MAANVINPFITMGYAGKDYFCDREKESETLTKWLINGNNVALISPRRMGKSGLILRCFDEAEIKRNYNTFYIDIYSTTNLNEFVIALGKEIVGKLQPKGERALNRFIRTVSSLAPGVSFDAVGNPTLTLQSREIKDCDTSLSEIFRYLEMSPKKNIVAIDEFQQITEYPQKGTEALLRTYIQRCNNAHFIFSGSRRHTMGNIFLSAARPFYQSVSMINLGSIDPKAYFAFAQKHFKKAGKQIKEDKFRQIYDEFEGVTWYVQKMLNALYTNTRSGEEISSEDIESAKNEIIDGFSYNYADTLYRLSNSQRSVLLAIAREGKIKEITGSRFISAHSLGSSASVQSAVKWLLKNDFITTDADTYYVYDYFFAKWLQRKF